MPNSAPWGGNPNRARVRRASQLPPPTPPTTGCRCPMVAAVHSARRGRYRLARRYAMMSVRLLAARA
jgi:hypothetical protein